jgi:long-chain acyl-CoA synthetase
MDVPCRRTAITAGKFALPTISRQPPTDFRQVYVRGTQAHAAVVGSIPVFAQPDPPDTIHGPVPQAEHPNFYAVFASAAERFGGRVAVEMQGAADGGRVSYRELRDMAERTAGWLASRKVGAGERVAILADNDARWCAAYLGMLRAGAVAVPLDTAYSAAQIATLLADSGARLIFTSGEYVAIVEEAVRAVRNRPAIVVLGESAAPVSAHQAFASVLAHAPAGGACPATSSDPAVILYTSGTTSDPKGVVLTHGNLLAERAAAFRIVRVSERDSVLSVLPLFHALALLANLLLPFSVGARVVFLSSVNSGELARALKECGITLFVCVPQFFYLLHRRIEDEIGALPWAVRVLVRLLAAANLRVRRHLRLNAGRVVFRRVHRSVGPGLRVLVTGGARFDPDSNRALHALGFTIQQAYGLTECAGAATITRAGDLSFDSVGRPLAGVDVRVQEPAAADAREAQRGRVDGEVLIRGPILMPGYFNRPEQTAITLDGGWLHTGDLGYLDPGGQLHITGRSKEVIVLGSGKNIYPEEIEAHYERSAYIKELCVAGVARPGEPTAERLHAMIRPDLDAMRARGMLNIRELLRFEIEGLSVQLPAHKRILGYDITLDPLPRTTTRKLKRFVVEGLLRDRAQPSGDAAQRSAGASALEADDDPVRVRILSEMRGAIRPDATLARDAHLELDVGLDSMERVELLVHLTSAFGIEIPDGEAQTLHTVGDLVEAVRSRVAAVPHEREPAAPWERLLQATMPGDPYISELERPKRVRAVLFFLVMKSLYAISRVAVGLRADGQGRLPARGPYLISPNHQSYVDVFLIVGCLPFRAFRNLFFVGAAEYFETPLMRWFARTLNVVPIDPDANLVTAMQMGAEGLRRGRVLVLFPEGERSIDGEVRTFRKGAAILSYHLGVPIVPVAIDGAWAIWPRGHGLNWRTLLPWTRTRVRVQFGPPIPPAVRPEYGEHTRALRDRVVAMWDALHASRLSA